tara:strand:- start:610 stop:1431 length:822 start_codon:yes stop_codon:yes gene_type:complete
MEELVLTRYLFSYSEVKHSLFIEILDGNVGAALYWGYELYWSGYEDDTFEWLLKTYDLMFELDEEFKNRISEEYDEWKENNELYEKLGTIIINMCYRPFSISKFMNMYFSTQCIDNDKKNRNSNLYINMSKDDVREYITLYGEIGGRYKITSSLYKYDLRTEMNTLFRYDIKKENQMNSLFYNWEYYAIKCPYWKERFNRYGGCVKQGKIVFNTDDELEEFYDKYSLEIDEMSKDVQNRVLGINENKAMSLKDFAKRYNGILKTKKLKKKVII